ncbi:EamA domain-containing membrane protein RarD [Cyclobacterium xiamenense]|uniref:EamA domain-containing membrane protein RarD n=1 Tax=Cyclobacterium xiamenense TaxID=1297121 RepID=A0A1H6W055_9BACT|nr:DMT family transporter [Cyclobacterium xiamenense]SEJ10331.1 EamA domain-containing membrane protein RarD [Cyclobacterium xiamenense]
MPDATSESQLKQWAMLVLLALIWGSSFILIKKALLVFSAGEVGAFRIVMAGTVLLPFAIPQIKLLQKKQLTYLLTIGFVGSFIPAFLFATAQTNLSSSLAGVINALTPLMVVAVGAFFFQARITLRNAIGLLIAFVGVGILVVAGGEGTGTELFSTMNLYGLLVVAATICYGLNVNIIKFRVQEIEAKGITSVSLMMVLPLAAIYLWGFTDFSFKLLHVEGAWKAAGYVAALGIVGTAAALVLFNAMVKLVTPVFASSVTYLVPMVALFWGVLDGERLFPFHYLGILAVILGVWLGNRKPKSPK